MTSTAEPYVPLVVPPERRNEPAWWFVFRGAELLVAQSPAGPALPCGNELATIGLEAGPVQYLGTYAGRHCYVADLPETTAVPAAFAMQGLRALFGQVDESLAALAGRAYQIKEWDRNHRFCGRCGTPTERRQDERARKCPGCGRTSYPPVSPAVMVLVTRGRELLLARKPGWEPGRFSALAGFVEPGETLEDTVRRETREEVSVEVRNLRYFGSQPWPFPHSLMVAFTAEHAGNAIKPDGVEIEEARWFDAGQLPKLPGSISISRRLIDTTAARLARGEKV